MSALISMYMGFEKLEALINEQKMQGKKGLSFTINVSDNVNSYGQNVSAMKDRTREQRDAGVKAEYIGNGKVVWTDGKIAAAPRKDAPAQDQQPNLNSDLPF